MEPEAFWVRVAVGDPNECWPWLKGSANGYGYVWWDGKVQGAHRIAFLLAYGYLPNVCRHSCDNTLCCNPLDLLDGTHLDNMRDMRVRGRSNRGERNGAARLNAELVREIRSSPETQDAIAARLGVTQTAISLIRRGKRWQHIDPSEAT